MANIIIQENGSARTRPAVNGEEITILAPCNCSEVTGVKIADTKYPFYDAAGNDLSSVSNLFAKDQLIKVLIDTTNTRAILVTTPAYTHPTTAGNKHIPSGGSTGQVLGYSASGAAQWSQNCANILTCSTANTTAAKTVSATGFSLFTGATVRVLFSNGNNVANPTLNVNSTGAKSIRVLRGGTKLPIASQYGDANNGAYSWQSNTILELMYDGTYWIVLGNPIVSSSIGTTSYKVYIDGYKDISCYVNISNSYACYVTLPINLQVTLDSSLTSLGAVSIGGFASFTPINPSSTGCNYFLDVLSSNKIGISFNDKTSSSGNLILTGYEFKYARSDR